MHQVSRLLTQLDHIIKSLKHKHGKRKKEVRRTKLYTTRMRWKLGKFNTLGLFFTFCCSNIIKNYRKGHYTNTKLVVHFLSHTDMQCASTILQRSTLCWAWGLASWTSPQASTQQGKPHQGCPAQTARPAGSNPSKKETKKKIQLWWVKTTQKWTNSKI